MSITLDAALGTGKKHLAGPAVPLTFSTTSAVSAGAVVVVCFAGFMNPTTATWSISAGGLTWATATGFPATSGSLKAYIWTAVAASGLASGSTVTITPSTGTSHDTMCAAISFLGVDTTNPVSATNSGSATGTGWTTGNLTANSGDALVGFAFEDGSATATSTPTSPAVEFADFNDATQTEAFTAAYKLSVAGTDTVAGTWSTSVTSIRGGVGLLAASGGAGGSTVKPLALLGVG